MTTHQTDIGLFNRGTTSLYLNLLPLLGEVSQLVPDGPRLSLRLGSLQSESAAEERALRSEQAMLGQVSSWLMLKPPRLDDGEDDADSEGEQSNSSFTYDAALLQAIYALGRKYYEMGFLAPAEKLFSGLVAVDEARLTPARLGLGVIRLEFGAWEDAASQFRRLIDLGGAEANQEGQNGLWQVAAKLGLACAFIGQAELSRAQTLLAEVAQLLQTLPGKTERLRNLWMLLYRPVPR